jgi:hypothetical protein
MSSYSYLTKIADPHLRAALKLVLDRLGAVEQSAQSIGTVSKPLDDHLDASSKQLKAVADPTDNQDAVTKLFLQKYVDDRLRASGLIDNSGNAIQPTDSDGGQTQAGVAAAGADGHVAGTDLTAYRAGQIIGGVAHEFPALVAATADQATRDSNQLELLLRIIWHLHAGGFTVGRQMNPSGILSTDKIALIEDGQLRAFDIFTGVYTDPLTVQAFMVSPPNLVAEAGTPD